MHRHRRDDTHTHTHTYSSADELTFPHKGIYRTEERLTGQYMDPYLASYQNQFRSKTMELEAAALAKGAGVRRSWCRLLLSRNLLSTCKDPPKVVNPLGRRSGDGLWRYLTSNPKGQVQNQTRQKKCEKAQLVPVKWVILGKRILPNMGFRSCSGKLAAPAQAFCRMFTRAPGAMGAI